MVGLVAFWLGVTLQVTSLGLQWQAAMRAYGGSTSNVRFLTDRKAPKRAVVLFIAGLVLSSVAGGLEM